MLSFAFLRYAKVSACRAKDSQVTNKKTNIKQQPTKHESHYFHES